MESNENKIIISVKKAIEEARKAALFTLEAANEVEKALESFQSDGSAAAAAAAGSAAAISIRMKRPLLIKETVFFRGQSVASICSIRTLKKR